MGVKDGELLFKQAMETERFSRREKLLKKSWELGYLGAATELWKLYSLSDSSCEYIKGHKLKKIHSNNVKAYQMLIKAAKGGVTKALYSLSCLTKEVDFRSSWYDGYRSELSGSLDYHYWRERAALAGDPAGQYFLGWDYRNVVYWENGLAAGWWYLMAAQQGEWYKKNANEDIRKMKVNLVDRDYVAMMPSASRLVVSLDLFSLAWPDVLEEPKNSGQHKQELKKFYRTASWQVQEDCARFQEGLRAYYGVGEKRNYLKAIRIFLDLSSKKGYKELRPLTRELSLAIADLVDEVALRGEATAMLEQIEDLRDSADKLPDDMKDEIYELAAHFDPVEMARGSKKYWDTMEKIAGWGDLYRMAMVVNHYRYDDLKNEEKAAEWEERLHRELTRTFEAAQKYSFSACYALGSFYIHLKEFNTDKEKAEQDLSLAKKFLLRSVQMGSSPAKELLDSIS